MLDSIVALGENTLAAITRGDTSQTHLDILSVLLTRIDDDLSPFLTKDSPAYKFLVRCLQQGTSTQTLALQVVSS